MWRQKEQFSDGIGYSRIDSLIEDVTSQVSHVQMATALAKHPVNTSSTIEAYFYREIFHKYYPQESAAKSVKRWILKRQKDLDPSGRANNIHVVKSRLDRGR